MLNHPVWRACLDSCSPPCVACACGPSALGTFKLATGQWQLCMLAGICCAVWSGIPFPLCTAAQMQLIICSRGFMQKQPPSSVVLRTVMVSCRL
jgi:hypothetical protein